MWGWKQEHSDLRDTILPFTLHSQQTAPLIYTLCKWWNEWVCYKPMGSKFVDSWQGWGVRVIERTSKVEVPNSEFLILFSWKVRLKEIYQKIQQKKQRRQKNVDGQTWTNFSVNKNTRKVTGKKEGERKKKMLNELQDVPEVKEVSLSTERKLPENL